MQIPFIDLKTQYHTYKDEIDQEIAKVLESGLYIGGCVADLERELARFVGTRYAIACSSGTDALLLALMALGIGPGDEVITTPFTFIATAETIAFLGAKPVFVDIEETTYTIDPSKIEAAITPKTKAIIPVSLFGQVADMEEIIDIANVHGLKVIEDGAQSFGATYKGKRSCGLSDIGCTSFFPAKPLGCYGDGGALFTDDEELAEKIKILRNHGQVERYKHKYIGINGRLDAIQAAVLLVKLRHYEAEITKRNKIAQRYDQSLKNLILPKVKEDRSSVWAQYCVRSTEREAIIARCNEHQIPTNIYYPIPLHLQEVFAYLEYKVGDFPVSEQIAKEIFALPMSAFLQEQDQDYIIGVVNG